MQHLDEGTIHTWLDGQLPRDEAAAVEAHVAECRQCADVVAEARGLIAASSRILLALDDVPALQPSANALQPSAISHQPSAPGAPASANAPIIARVPAESAGRRAQRRWFRGPSLAAAATIVVAVGTFALTRAGGDKTATFQAAPDAGAERDRGPAALDTPAVVSSAPVPAPAPTSAPAVANEARDARADGERRALADAATSAGRRDAPQRLSEPPVAGSQSERARQELRKSVPPADQAAASPRERDEAQARSRAAAPAPPPTVA